MEGNGEDDLPQTPLEGGSVLGSGAARDGAAARVLQSFPLPKCVWKRVRKSSPPHFVCLLRLYRVTASPESSRTDFTWTQWKRRSG